MKAKLVREALVNKNKDVYYSIEDLCDGTVSWDEISPHILNKNKSLPDPGFYTDKRINNEKDYIKYLENFEEKFGCEGVLYMDEWNFWHIKDNPRYYEDAVYTSKSVGYDDDNRYMGD